MKLDAILASWPHHSGNPIYSVDFSPDGLRVATGGKGPEVNGLVAIWDATNEDEDGPPLCHISEHMGCVNCVRWNATGSLLASCSDDRLVMIWHLVGLNKPVHVSGDNAPSAFSANSNLEIWRCLHTLTGHQGDVVDIAWSPSDKYLASASLDNDVIVWDARHFPAQIAKLRGHGDLVKGVTWDPVGKYLATQSVKCVKVWSTSNWSCVHTVAKPFGECTTTTFVLRLSWSTDGAYIVSAQAMNNAGSTAQLITRNNWIADVDLVGHKKAVTCVRFNPVMFMREVKSKSGKVTMKEAEYLATGSRDKTVSIWRTGAPRPVATITNAFRNTVMDLSWSKCGTILAGCSLDGSVSFFNFKANLGTPISTEEKYGKLVSLYGRVELPPGVSVKGQPDNDATGIIHAPAILHFSMYGKLVSLYGRVELPPGVSVKGQPDNDATGIIHAPAIFEARREAKEIIAENEARHDKVDPPLTPKTPVNISLTQSPQKGQGKQMETRTSDGKRRIQPLFLGSSLMQCVPSGSGSANSTPRDPSREPEGMETPTEGEDSEADADDEEELGPRSTVQEPSAVVVRADGSVRVSKKRPADSTTTPDASKKERRDICTCGASRTLLPQKERQKTFVYNTNQGGHSIRITAENDHLILENIHFHRVKCTIDDVVKWENLTSAPVICVEVGSDFVVLGQDDGTVDFIGLERGDQRWQGVRLDSPSISIQTNAYGNVLFLTESGRLFLCDVRSRRFLARDVDLPFAGAVAAVHVTDVGVPLVTKEDGTVWAYCVPQRAWESASIFDPLDALAGAEPESSTTDGDNRPSSSIQSERVSLRNVPPELVQLKTLKTLSANYQAAKSLSQPFKEIKFRAERYVMYMVNAALKGRLTAFCEELLDDELTDPYLSGERKRDVLRSVLPIIATNDKLQSVYLEFRDRLELRD